MDDTFEIVIQGQVLDLRNLQFFSVLYSNAPNSERRLFHFTQSRMHESLLLLYSAIFPRISPNLFLINVSVYTVSVI